MKTKWNHYAKALMREQGISQETLADYMGITKGGLSHWLNGRREPNIDDIAKILRFMGKKQFTVNHEGMIIDESINDLQPWTPPADDRGYPVITFEQIGQMEALDLRKTQHYTSGAKCSENSFWLVIHGESMQAPTGFSLPAGAAVLVDPSKIPEDGKIVLARLERDASPIIKQLATIDGVKVLRSLNPLYPALPMNPESEVIGVIVDARLTNLP